MRRGKIGRRTPKFFGGIFWTKNSIFTVVQIFFVNSPALVSNCLITTFHSAPYIKTLLTWGASIFHIIWNKSCSKKEPDVLTMYISWVQSFHQKELGYVTLEKRCSTEHCFKTSNGSQMMALILLFWGTYLKKYLSFLCRKCLSLFT